MCLNQQGRAALSEAALPKSQPRSKEQKMSRNLACALGLVSSAIAAAFALSITVVPTDAYAGASGSTQAGRAYPWKSSDAKYGPDEWSLQLNDQVMPQNTGYTRAQAQAEFKTSRELVRTLTAEDSGSGYFKRPGELGGTNVMGAAAR